MADLTVGWLGLAALVGMLLLRVPVGAALLGVGFVGTWIVAGLPVALEMLAGQAWATTSTVSLAVIPLFILMGNLAARSGMSRDLYEAAYAWVGRWRGGLASSTIVGCAGFAALSGSSLASAVTMGRVALPEMRRYGYADALATGTVAAGGTLGILIPPSTGFVVYAIMTEQSIGRLFIAGILPGLMLMALFIVVVMLIGVLRPASCPEGPQTDWPDRLRRLRRATTIVGIVGLTIGGIYAGAFTPGEASAIGAFLTLVAALLRRTLDRAAAARIIADTLATTGMAFFILYGAHVFAPFIALTGLPGALAGTVEGLGLGPAGTLWLILAGFIVLGTVLEGLALLVLSLPIVFPMIVGLGYDPIWFGVIMVIVLEMGLISPPVGINVFVVKSVAGDVPMRRIFIGVLPFWAAMLVAIAALVAFPGIALHLPSRMLG